MKAMLVGLAGMVVLFLVYRGIKYYQCFIRCESGLATDRTYPVQLIDRCVATSCDFP